MSRLPLHFLLHRRRRKGRVGRMHQNSSLSFPCCALECKPSSSEKAEEASFLLLQLSARLLAQMRPIAAAVNTNIFVLPSFLCSLFYPLPSFRHRFKPRARVFLCLRMKKGVRDQKFMREGRKVQQLAADDYDDMAVGLYRWKM